MRVVAFVTEGHGDVESVPLLVRRIGAALEIPIVPTTPKPVRIPRSKLLKPGELERAVQFAALRAGNCGAVMVLIDADDDCPATLGPELLARVAGVALGVPAAVVTAKHEFENWFIAAAESLRGQRGLRDDLVSLDDPEGIRGAKEWLSRHMAESYSPSVDQAALAASMDLDAARAADSFDKFWRETERLLDALSACT
jgi:hypothetical protein